MAIDFFVIIVIICLQIMYLLKTNHENTRKCDNCSSHSCIVIKNSASLNILFDKCPTVLTDMLMLKQLGFIK